ncbi:unnamed protein product [Closterium sp. Yama58-4]|nr:unnamed protein product [Closterium sp. Yama58-4]
MGAADALRGRKAHIGMMMDHQGMLNTTAAAGSSKNPSEKASNEGGAANNEDKDPAGAADEDEDDDDEAGGGGLSSRRKEAARKLQQWREFFRGVVLVLHFSRPVRAWQTLEFWRHVYGRVFDDMVTVSTEAIPELGVIAATPSPATNTDASLSYTALPTIMEQHASASGFLWLGDEAVLNYWAVADTPLDKNKIWYLNSSNPNHLLTLPLDQPPSAPIRTALDPSDLPTHISTSLSHLSESLRAQLDRSLWPRHHSFPLAASPSSAFFIPQRLVDSAALHVIPVFAAEAIPAQVAIPLILFTLEHPKLYDPRGFTDARVINPQVSPETQLQLQQQGQQGQGGDDPISDHSFAIRVALRCTANAKIGPGVWRLPIHSINRPGVRKVVEAAVNQAGGDFVLLLAKLNAGLKEYAKEEIKRVKATLRHLSDAVGKLKQAVLGAPACPRLRELLKVRETQLKEYQATRRDRLHLMAGYGEELKGEVVSKHLSARIKTRKKRTHIAELRVNGAAVRDRHGILKEAANFYTGLFGADKRTHQSNWLPDRRLPAAEAEELVRDWSEQEVRDAINALACGKSPGLDGIPNELFELHWDLLGDSFMRLARSFAASALLPTSTKEAVTILLHKKGDKDLLANYRPITLLNFTYKVLAKVVADRMK